MWHGIPYETYRSVPCADVACGVGRDRIPDECGIAADRGSRASRAGRRGPAKHPASQESRDLFAVDTVVLGLAAVERLHVEVVPQYEVDRFAAAQVDQPVPDEHAFATHD